ncbi:capsular biosynthesis protein [Erythrobacter sp. KY5]|uniref:P-loop NTPase n=1 Tax=Erythrobacter sp. KY5 TaxID=2011159 RepID=UPI000DBF1E72|nr:P-loop NTPase [Erythrobacter sp. KY5]AWW74899.1 capsular biosynthesis protein [Erythrobacter sp. KY5]
MTEHSKIDRKSAERAHKSASLFERADAAFGLDRIAPAVVPNNLPRTKRPPERAQASPAPRPAPSESARVQTQPAPTPRVEQPLALKGQRVTVDRGKLRDAGLIVPEEPVTGLLEEFRIVKRELIADARAAGDDASRRVLVCSPHSGEGKTYCAANLALALSAERDIEVVLVDADVINPSVSRRLGIEEGAGLMDALVDPSIKPENLVSATDIDGLFVMQAGTSSVLDAEYLTSARTGEVLDRLTRGAPNRFLIFDTPPALAASPAAELAAHAGQALLVVRADETSRAALDDARQLLSACPDIKLLLNAAQFSPSGRRFGDYGEREE